jgi:hypothetical protein
VTPWSPGPKWKADAKFGFLGRRPSEKGGTPQPLHKGVHVDLEEVLRASAPALTVWRAHSATEGASLYSGGVLDCWPAWVVEVLQVAQAEVANIKAFLTTEASDG